MRRTITFLLTFVLVTSSFVGGCGKQSSPKRLTAPFTTDYPIDASNIDSFLSNDTVETAITGGPFYTGAQALPSQNTGAFEKARKKKVAQIHASAEDLVKAIDEAKPVLASFRSEYTTYLNLVYKEEVGLSDIAVSSLESVTLAATKEVIGEEQYRALAAQETTQAYATAMRDYLAVGKAIELAGLQLQDADMITSFSAVMVNGLAQSSSAKAKQATEAYDKQMKTSLAGVVKALDPVVQKVADVNLGLDQLASADYYFTLEAVGYMKSETTKLDREIEKLAVRDGLTQADVDGIKAYYAAFKELNASMEEHVASVETSGLIEVSTAPFPDFGPDLAYAAGDYSAGENLDAGMQLMQAGASAEPPAKGWLESGWDTVKGGFGKLKTGIGTGVDSIGLGVRNITTVGAGLYYGNSGKDMIDDIMTNTKEMADNYDKGVSGSSTFKTAGGYLEGVETGAGDTAGGAAAWTFEKILGKGRISGTAGWAVNGITKISVGLFTGLGKGIYKVADKSSSTEDVAMGFIEIGLSAVGGSKLIIKASQLPGLLKGGAEGAKAFSKIVTNLVGSASNAAEGKAIGKKLAELLVAKGMTPANAANLISNSIKLEINQAVGQLLRGSRETMVKKIRDLLAKGGTGALTNFKETAKGSLEELLSKGFAKTFGGYLEAGTTVLGTSVKDYVDNLVAAGLTDGVLSELIKTALSIPPDPAQVSGVWRGTVIVTAMDIPKSEEKTAEEAGCEQVFGEFRNKANAAVWTIKLNNAGAGTVTLGGSGGKGSGTARYSDGAITMSIAGSGYRYTFKGTVSFVKTGGMRMSGTWSAPFKNSKITMSGTFSAAK